MYFLIFHLSKIAEAGGREFRERGTHISWYMCLVPAFDTLFCHHHSTNPGILAGGALYFRLDIILVKGLSKHTLNTYFSGMKTNPKYAFLLVIFLNLCIMSFPKFVNMAKNIPFFQFCTFLHP